jgi:plastocyanin
MKRSLYILLFGLGVFLLSACSSGPPPAEFTIEMTEFAYSPTTFEVQVGQEVTFQLINNGALDHEFMVGRDMMLMENIPNGYEHNLFEGEAPMVMGGADEHTDDGHGSDSMDHGFMVIVPKNGEERTVTFTVTEDMVGEWEIGCFVDGGSHYTQGMIGKLIVMP